VRIDDSYDATSRLHTKQWIIRGDRFQLGVGYDSVGRLLVASYPHAGGTAFRLAYQYGAFGELVGVVNAVNGTQYWQRSTSDASGQFARDVLGNGVITECLESSWHPGLIQQIKDTDSSGKEVQNLIYGFDAQLNVKIRTDQVLKAREIAKYDDYDRLVDWHRTSSDGFLKATWSYDDGGNILTSTRLPALGSTTLVYGYGADSAGPNAVSSIGSDAFAYDYSGNRIDDHGRAIDFTSFGLPKSLTSGGSVSTYEYDGERRRVYSAWANGEQVVSLADLYERRIHDRSQRFLVRVYGKAVAQIVRQQGKSDDVIYLHTDHLGSLQAATDANGALIEYVRYTPYGLLIDPAQPSWAPPSSNTSVMIGFGGHTTNSAADLIDMRGRWYDTKTARFLSPDLYRPQPCRGQRQNAYTYAINNPLTISDPSGFDPEADNCLPDLIQRWLRNNGKLPDYTWSDLYSAHDWALQQLSAAGAVANDTGSGGAGISELPMHWLGSMPQNLSGMSFGRESAGSIYPEFSNESEPRQARRLYTREFKERASTELPGPRILDFQNANMGGHIANLRFLLAQNGIATKLVMAGTRIEVLASAPFGQVRAVMENLYYSRGDFTINFIDHRGGQEFRNWASAGFHMKVAYPSVFGVDNGPTRITDLHLDPNNPLDPNKLFEHMKDFSNVKR
jgi:RHS repeat-associated protein